MLVSGIDTSMGEDEIRAQLHVKARARFRQSAREDYGVEALHFSPRMARRSIMRFTQATYPEYVPEPLHYRIGAELDKVVAGEVKRLLIIAPPRHGKSELCSVRLPAYWLGKKPNDPIITTSSGATLAEDFSAQAKNLIRDDSYREIFPYIKLKGDSSAKDFWRIADYLGYVRAAGFGGNIMGRGMGLGLIDDPIASWAEAQSETARDNVYNWYKGTFRHRLQKGGAIVLIQTRWHEDDLAGRLMLEQPGLWTVLRFPALAESQEERDEYSEKYGLPLGESDPLGREEGEILAPERMPEAEINSLRTELGSLVFSALYQGNPRPPEGNVFKEHWFPPEIFLTDDQLEFVKFVHYIRYWDKAGTDAAGAFTVGLLMAVDEDGLFYLLDVKRAQLSDLERNKMIKNVTELDYKRYGHNCSIWIEQEPGSGGKESAAISQRQLAGYNVRIDPVSDSKGVRLRPYAAQCEAGNVRIKKADWTKAYVGELLEWSEKAKYVDQVDASSGAFNHLTLDGTMAEDKAKLLARALGGRYGKRR